MHFVTRLAALALSVIATHAVALDNVRMVGVVFDHGHDTAEITDEITGDESVMYRFRPKVGQIIHVSLRPNNQRTEFKLYAPGKWPGEELHDSKSSGSREFKGRVTKDGFHAILVSQDQGASKEGETASYDLVITLKEKAGEDKPAVSQAESDCLSAVADQVGNDDVSTISFDIGETSTKVMVQVPGAQAPWQCNWGYRDGKPAVLEVFYAGEG